VNKKPKKRKGITQPMCYRVQIHRSQLEIHLVTSIKREKGYAVTINKVNSTFLEQNKPITKKKGRTQCRRLPALCGVWGRVVLSPKPYPHKCAEAGARTRDLPGLCN